MSDNWSKLGTIFGGLGVLVAIFAIATPEIRCFIKLPSNVCAQTTNPGVGGFTTPESLQGNSSSDKSNISPPPSSIYLPTEKPKISEDNDVVDNQTAKNKNNDTKEKETVKFSASKVVYGGNKGTYIIDFEVGIYQGCTFNKGCIYLGPDKRFDKFSWKNGNYLYTISKSEVIVYLDENIIFRDTLQIPEDNNTKNNPEAEIKKDLSKVTYSGKKGTYTIDFKVGVYQGCTTNKGCIYLGSDKRVDKFSWKNGSYLYRVSENEVIVYLKGNIIFKDTFN